MIGRPGCCLRGRAETTPLPPEAVSSLGVPATRQQRRLNRATPAAVCRVRRAG